MAFPFMAAAVGASAVASIFGSSKGAKAAENGAALQAEATREATALNEKIYTQTRADNEPFRQVGIGAAQALSGGLGIAAPSMTGGSANYGTPAGGGAAPSMTGGTPSPAAGSPDWNGYLAANGDVADSEWLKGIDPSAIGDRTGDGQVTMEDRAAFHYENYGQQEGWRTVPTVAPAPSMTGQTPGGPAPGYADPTAPQGYDPGERPTYDAAQPSRSQFTMPDLSLSSFRASPDFNFRVQQGEKGLDNAASSMGGIMSGRRIKAGLEFNQNLADAEYTDWRNFTMGQANIDRARSDGIYSEDQGTWERGRARSDGLYQDDRSNLNQRYDTRNNTLLSMAGFGTGANASNNSAAQSFAANQNALTMTNANNQAQAGITAANAWNQGLGNLMTTGAYLYGNR